MGHIAGVIAVRRVARQAFESGRNVWSRRLIFQMPDPARDDRDVFDVGCFANCSVKSRPQLGMVMTRDYKLVTNSGYSMPACTTNTPRGSLPCARRIDSRAR
jgi:hypothetical protein